MWKISSLEGLTTDYAGLRFSFNVTVHSRNFFSSEKHDRHYIKYKMSRPNPPAITAWPSHLGLFETCTLPTSQARLEMTDMTNLGFSSNGRWSRFVLFGWLDMSGFVTENEPRITLACTSRLKLLFTTET